jgi:hypothetical protein
MQSVYTDLSIPIVYAECLCRVSMQSATCSSHFVHLGSHQNTSSHTTFATPSSHTVLSHHPLAPSSHITPPLPAHQYGLTRPFLHVTKISFKAEASSRSTLLQVKASRLVANSPLPTELLDFVLRYDTSTMESITANGLG